MNSLTFVTAEPDIYGYIYDILAAILRQNLRYLAPGLSV